MNPATKPQHTVFPVFGMCWGKDGTEIVGMANQLLMQAQTHERRVLLSLKLIGVLGLRQDVSET